MKTKMLIAGLLTGSVSMAESLPVDTTRMVELQKVEVIANRANSKTPMAYTTVGKRELRRFNNAQDLPYLLLMTPSVVTTSDAGAGVGYTGIRVRGTDATRINVTANGVPLNDAQSHSLYWVNMPDFVSSVEDLQIQRGVGISTNGSGAFGASLNFKTEAPATEAGGEVSGGYGSFNTHREMVKVSTGLMGGHWVLDARLSNIESDGYIDRASSDLESYYAKLGYYGDRSSLKVLTFAGKEKTYLSWAGATLKEMDKYGRRYNANGVIEQNGEPVGYYDNQTDNYIQRNYQMIYSLMLSDSWNMNVTLHYTNGKGYYEEYKNGRKLTEYGLESFEVDGTTIKKTNLIRQKHMKNDFGGGLFSFDYRSDKLEMSFGGAANRYDGNHFGLVTWVQDYINFNKPLQSDHEYYANDAIKDDVNVYAKATYEVATGLNLFADLQYRHVEYSIDGNNDNYDWINSQMQKLNVDDKYDFFNPKAGLQYTLNDRNKFYASFAVAHKEPTRNNYTDAKFNTTPMSERLFDYELGYNYLSPRFSAGANLYYMDYEDQLVLTGEVNDIGEPLAANVDKSYRAGIELTAGVKITDWLRWDVNSTFSRNKIKDYTEYLSVYDDNDFVEQQSQYLGTVDIAYSPSVIANSLISVNYKGWSAALQSHYVGEQYMSNSEIKELQLDGYFVNNLHLAYAFSMPLLKSVKVGFSIYNLFDEKYCNNGFGSSSLYRAPDGKQTRSEYAYYFPQAGTNFMANVSIRF